MRYHELGRTGLRVSVLSLGTWQSEDEGVDRTLIRRAFDAGVNLFDTADAYGEKGEVELAVGRQIKELPRDEFILATKCRWGYGAAGENRRGLSRKHMAHAIDGSLRRLGVDFVDLYQIHSPDPQTPLAEPVRMMGDLVRQGKVLYWGLSNFNSTQTVLVLKACGEMGVPPPVSTQPEYSILSPGLVESRGRLVTGLDEICRQFGLGIVAYSPLCGGLLSGKYRQGIPPGSRLDRHADLFGEKMLQPQRAAAVEKLAGVAREAGLTLAQMSLAWVVQRPAVTSAIMGATRVEQLAENLQAGDVELSPETVAAIEAVRDEYKWAGENQGR